MSTFAHISPNDVAQRLGSLTVVDIRDPNSFRQGHIPGAQPLNNENFAQFLAQTPRETPVVVVCYHGISSQQAAAVVAQQGFSEVYSMDGGFEGWKLAHPVETENS